MMPENPLYFRINEDVPNPPDVYATGGPTTIYSERLTKLIIDTGISCEIIPVVMLGRTTNQSLPIKYNIVYLNEIHPAVNLEKTIKHDFIIEKLVLTENCKKQRHLFFRPEEIPYFILIHKDFKVILEEQKITGCEYLPLDSS